MLNETVIYLALNEVPPKNKNEKFELGIRRSCKKFCGSRYVGNNGKRHHVLGSEK